MSFAAADFEMTVANPEVWALPISAKSCVAWKNGSEVNDVPDKHINLGNLTFTWADTNRAMTIQYLKITMRDSLLPNGEHECVIKGEELAALGAPGWTSIPKASKKSTAQIRETDCLLVCGGITFTPDIAATVVGKIEARGIATDDKGAQTEVVTGQSITVDNVTF
jgi:hypothetical protein